MRVAIDTQPRMIVEKYDDVSVRVPFDEDSSLWHLLTAGIAADVAERCPRKQVTRFRSVFAVL